MSDHGIRKQEKTTEQDGVLEMVIKSFEVDAITTDGYYPVLLNTSRGIVYCRYYAAENRERAIICVGGEEGGWDTPMHSRLYPHLCNVLSRQNINCLRIQFRHASDMAESILDVLAGITFLTQDGVSSLGIVGYSQGATVAVQAAAASPLIMTVVSISPRVFGFNAISSLRKEQSILMLHGSLDVNASAAALSQLYEYAHDPKKIIFYSQANKKLDEVAPEASRLVQDWLVQHM